MVWYGDQFQKCIRAQFQSSERTTMAIRRISRSHVKLWNNGKLDRVRSNIRVTCIVVLSKRYIFFKKTLVFHFCIFARCSARSKGRSNSSSFLTAAFCGEGNSPPFHLYPSFSPSPVFSRLRATIYHSVS